jgi:hypothetical protein
MGRDIKDQHVGGNLLIPSGYAVIGVDFDADEPFCTIIREDLAGEEIKLLIPKSLAYYLTTHDIGSRSFREQIEESAKNELRYEFRKLLNIGNFS